MKEYYNKLVKYNEFNHNPLHNKVIGKFFLDLLYKELNGELTEFKELEDQYTILLCKVYQSLKSGVDEDQIKKYIFFFSVINSIYMKYSKDVIISDFFALTLPCSWETGYEFME